MPRPVSRTVNCTKSLDLFGGQQNLAVVRRVAQRVGQQVVENGAQRAAVGLHRGEIGVGAHIDADVLSRSLVAVAVATLRSA